MSIYERFAYFYARGPYPQYSRRMVELLPPVLERFGLKATRLLDLACGEGTFAVEMEEKGLPRNQVVRREGIEPSTSRLRVCCST